MEQVVEVPVRTDAEGWRGGGIDSGEPLGEQMKRLYEHLQEAESSSSVPSSFMSQSFTHMDAAVHIILF